MNEYYVYILASRSGVLYVGMTNDLERRVAEHQAKLVPGFSAEYRVDRLVWYESFSDVNDAIAAEKRIKGSRRSKKLALIEELNPKWHDLADEAMGTGAAPRSEIPRVAEAPLGMTMHERLGR